MDKTEIEKRIANGINYRALTLEIRKAETEDESFIVEGYATTFNEPYVLWEDKWIRVKEQVAPDAFANCDMSDVIMQYDHQGRVFARTANKTLELIQDEHGLKIRAYLGGTELGKQLYEEIKNGYTNKMSFGFTIETETRTEILNEEGPNEVLYTINSIGKLYDVSAVSLPANDGTEISARNRFNAEVEKRQAEAQEKAEEEQKQKEAEEAEKNKRARWLFAHNN